MLFRRNVI